MDGRADPEPVSRMVPSLPVRSLPQSRRLLLAIGGLLCLTHFLTCQPLTLPTFGPAAEAAGSDAAESTPDCGDLPPEPHPLQQRAKLMARLGVDTYHAAGVRGEGVTVAILDSGFRGYRDHLGKALPKQITVRSFRGDGNLEAKDSQHGILCGEVIHALAPEARLLLANWDADRPAQFLEAVGWARQQGARIISCSVIMPSWSDGEGNGTIHADLARLLGRGDDNHDLLCFASAGNIAQRHWAGSFHDAGKRLHEWVPGRHDNALSPWGRDQVSVELCWQAGPEYELCVQDDTAGTPAGRVATYRGPQRSTAAVRFQPRTGHSYHIQVRLVSGQPGSFHLAALGGGLGYSTASGSIPFPGDGPEVIAVGAVDADGHRASYSSCGPNSKQPKPDLVAIVPFPSLWRSRPFSGTSAAAPQAAAMAALVWAHNPKQSARQVREALRTAAHDLGPVGHDYETGYGLIHLP